MKEQDKGFGITMWRASGNGLSYECDSMKALGIETNFVVDSDQPGEYHWHMDGGLLITTPKFRNI